MKKFKDIIIGAIIAVVLLVIAVVISLIIVDSDIPSKASNDGWLSFIGSITGSFIAVFSSVVVMYINRKEMIKMQKNQIREKRTGEIASVREKLLEMFQLLEIDPNDKLYRPNFLVLKCSPCLRGSEVLEQINIVEELFQQGRFDEVLKKQESINKLLNIYEDEYVNRDI